MHSSAVASCCRARVGRDSQGKKRFKALNRLVASRSDLMLNDVLRMPKEMQLNMLHFGKITGKTIGYNTLLLCAKSGTLHRQKPIKKGAFSPKNCSFFYSFLTEIFPSNSVRTFVELTFADQTFTSPMDNFVSPDKSRKLNSNLKKIQTCAIAIQRKRLNCHRTFADSDVSKSSKCPSSNVRTANVKLAHVWTPFFDGIFSVKK